jgi:hypothetical protein
MENGLACHILISVCLLKSNLNVHAKPGSQAITRYNWHLNSSTTGSITDTSLEPLSLENKILRNLYLKTGNLQLAGWKHDVENDIRQIGIVNWRQVAQDRNGWRTATREVLILLG